MASVDDTASATMDTLTALREGRLSGVRELRLAGLGLTELPSEVFGLADTLRLLDIGGNRLSGLPADFGRLRHLEVLFASGNPMTCLPPVLGNCGALSQLGLRGCGLLEIAGEALPPELRWLTVTDNALASVPHALGERPRLQKLMLAGNRLRELPTSLSEAPNLELIRLAANGFEALPPWLARMPRLAWLAWSGNPLDAAADPPTARAIPWADLTLGTLLGEGASGRVHASTWRHGGDKERQVAVKLFKGTMTSDGLPGCEMAACLAAGTHPHLAGGLGRIEGHPQRVEALVLPLLPSHWRVLARPPSLASCSRDVYHENARFDADVALRIAQGIACAGAHIHACGLLHGDLYAHNILWDGTVGEAVLTDFGAASFVPTKDCRALKALDVLAFGLLLGELIDRCESVPHAACAVQRACVAADTKTRPSLDEVADALSR